MFAQFMNLSDLTNLILLSKISLMVEGLKGTKSLSLRTLLVRTRRSEADKNLLLIFILGAAFLTDLILIPADIFLF